MDNSLAMENFTWSKTSEIENTKERGNKDSNLLESISGVVDAASKVIDPITVLGYAKQLPQSLKKVKCFVDVFKLADDTRKLWNIESNLDLLRKVRRALDLKEDKYNYWDSTFKYYYSSYDEYKKNVRELNRRYILNKWNICLEEQELEKLKNSSNKDQELEQEIEKRQLELKKLKGINDSIARRINRKHKLKETVINNEAISINKHSSRRLRWKFAADLLSFAANIIEVFKFSTVAAFVCASRVPGAIYGICKKVYKDRDIFNKKIVARDDCILATLQLPALIADFWDAIDKWIFKKQREKSEQVRKELVLTNQLAYIEDGIARSNNFDKIGDNGEIIEDGRTVFNKIKEQGSKDKQKELIEKVLLVRDKEIQERTINELKDICDKLENSEDRVAIDKDIEKQRKRLTKIENDIINKTGRAPKRNKYTEETRNRKLREAIDEIKATGLLNVGDKGLDTMNRVFECSKKAEKILNVRPGGYLKYFKVKAMEDEDRIRSTARFIVNHIRNLPDIDNLDIDKLPEEEKDKYIHNKEEVEKSYARIESMLKTLNVGKDDVGNYIIKVREYKNKEEKDELVNELVDKMKEEIKNKNKK